MQRQAIPQRQFLSGLRNLINATKQLQLSNDSRLNRYLKSYAGLMLSRHLPSGVCKGYAVSYSNNRTTAEADAFNALYAATAQLAARNVESVKTWILQNQEEALRLLSFNDGLLMRHRIKTAYSKQYDTDYSASGLQHQVAISVNLPPQALVGLLNKHIIPYLNLPKDPQTAPQQIACFMISNGTHAVSVNVRFRFGAIHYRLNDANDTYSFETKDVGELSQAINSRFELVNQYDGQCVSYRIDVLSEKNDPIFDSILKRLEEYVAQLPEYLSGERVTITDQSQLTQHLSHKQLLQKLIDCYRKGQSRVGFLQEVMLYFNDPILARGRQYKAPIQEEILRYLSTQPSMAMILRDYRLYVNEPSRNGFSWLHQAIMTHEKHVVWWLMQQYQANPNLQPLFRPGSVNKTEASQGGKKTNLMLRGTNEETTLLNLDEEVQIIEGQFVHSNPAHYAAMLDDVELFSWLKNHGANMALAAGNGKTPQQMIKANGNIAATDAPREFIANGHLSMFSLFATVQAMQERHMESLRQQKP